MNHERPRSWNDEKWVIGELVSAINVGDSDAKEKFGQRLLCRREDGAA